MDPAEFDRLLDASGRKPAAPLPSGFSGNVLHRARQVRDFSRANQKLLAGVSAAALALALAVAWKTGPAAGSDQPPSLPLFQPGNPAQPFSTD